MLQVTADMQNNALSHKCMYAHAIILISDHRWSVSAKVKNECAIIIIRKRERERERIVIDIFSRITIYESNWIANSKEWIGKRFKCVFMMEWDCCCHQTLFFIEIIAHK